MDDSLNAPIMARDNLLAPSFPEDGTTCDPLMQKAADARYAARRSGGSHAVLASEPVAHASL